jgi:outer membrane protein assembly factor BamB
MMPRFPSSTSVSVASRVVAFLRFALSLPARPTAYGFTALGIGVCQWTLAICLLAEDWPTFRHGNSRLGSTSEIVHPEAQPRWVYRTAVPPQAAWSAGEGRVIENHLIGNLTRYDDAIHPVIAGQRVYFGSSVDHHLHCLDLATGQELWRFATDAPIRLAPTFAEQRIYFGADDGHAYCLSADDGRLIWKLRAGPADEWLIARGEMISRWPVRTSILVEEGVAYFGAGIFPHEDVFLYAVDANDGKLLWRQSNLSALDAGRNDLSPQGYLLASRDRLFVPSGRSLPAALDKKTGELLFKRTHSWRTTAGGVIGGVYALLADDQLYTSGPHHWLAIDQADGDVGFGWFAGRQIVVQGDDAFLATGQTLAKLDRLAYAVNSRRRHELEMVIYDASRKISTEPDRAVELRRQITEAQAELKKIAMVGITWQQAAEDDGSLIATGDRVFLGGKQRACGYDAESGERIWETSIDGEASGLVAGNQHLLVSSTSGSLYCFASSSSTAQPLATVALPPSTSPETAAPFPSDEKSAAYAKAAEEILEQAGSRRGFCLVVGNEDGRLAYELAIRSQLKIYAIEADAAKVQQSRERLQATGLYGNRIVIHQGPASALPYANYFANLIVSDTYLSTGKLPSPATAWSRHLKPLGGKLILGRLASESATAATENSGPPSPREELELGLEGPTTTSQPNPGWVAVTRGALPGAGDWSHQYGNPANTGVISETRVKSGLGVLWYGDPGPGEMVNRHDGAVGPLATHGRLFVQGETTILAYDAYNGLFLWKHENPKALRTGVFQNNNPSNLAANTERLFHFVKDECFELDAASGEVVRTHRLPAAYDNGEFEWGYLATQGDYLFGAATRRKELEAKQRRRGKTTEDATDGLFAIDLRTGQVAWSYQGQSISHHTIAISADAVYFIDSSITSEQRLAILLEDKTRLQNLPVEEQQQAEQRALATDVRRAVALDIHTGQPRWSVAVDVTDCSDIGAGGGKLSLLYQNNVLILGGANANGHYWKQFVAGEFTRRRMVALSAADGRKLWARDANYKGRPITIGDRVLAEPWSYDLYTGKQQMRQHPLTGEEVPWSLMRTGHHCGVLTGCDSGMLLFRSGDTAFYDLEADVGVQHFAGHRLGCWINAIPANGLVMIPEASAGCVCQFSIASTIVMEPRAPRREWTISSAVGMKLPVASMAINFGGPGDRKDADGTLWLSYPRRKAYQETALDLALDLKTEFASSGKYAGTSDTAVQVLDADIPWLHTTWAAGLKRFEVPLLGPEDPPADYRIRFHFINDAITASEAVAFDVKLQDEVVASQVSLPAGQPNEVVTKTLEFPKVRVTDQLKVEFVPHQGSPRIAAFYLERLED